MWLGMHCRVRACCALAGWPHADSRMGIALAAIAFRTWLNPRRYERSALRCCSTLLLFAGHKCRANVMFTHARCESPWTLRRCL